MDEIYNLSKNIQKDSICDIEKMFFLLSTKKEIIESVTPNESLYTKLLNVNMLIEELENILSEKLNEKFEYCVENLVSVEDFSTDGKILVDDTTSKLKLSLDDDDEFETVQKKFAKRIQNMLQTTLKKYRERFIIESTIREYNDDLSLFINTFTISNDCHKPFLESYFLTDSHKNFYSKAYTNLITRFGFKPENEHLKIFQTSIQESFQIIYKRNMQLEKAFLILNENLQIHFDSVLIKKYENQISLNNKELDDVRRESFDNLEHNMYLNGAMLNFSDLDVDIDLKFTMTSRFEDLLEFNKIIKKELKLTIGTSVGHALLSIIGIAPAAVCAAVLIPALSVTVPLAVGVTGASAGAAGIGSAAGFSLKPIVKSISKLTSKKNFTTEENFLSNQEVTFFELFKKEKSQEILREYLKLMPIKMKIKKESATSKC